MNLSADSSGLVTAAIGFAGVVVGGVIVGLSSLALKQLEYLNDYNKIVLQKRINAYEALERLISALKTAVMDTDRRPYHFLFAQEDGWDVAYRLIAEIMNEGLWLSDDAFDATRKLNYLMFHDAENRPTAIEFGKQHYAEIALLREDMERNLAQDLRTLHKVQSFLRKKSKAGTRGFVPLVADAQRGLRNLNDQTD